jgi:Tol biopolymer transport system component
MWQRLLRGLLVGSVLAVLIGGPGPAAAQSRKGRWGFGDNRYFIIDQICRDGMEVSAVDSSSSGNANGYFGSSDNTIDIGAMLYTTAVTLPVEGDSDSRLPAADYGTRLSPLRNFTLKLDPSSLPADTNNNGAFDSDEYYFVYMNGEFLLWTQVLTPGDKVVATHTSFNDSGAELGYSWLTVEDCYFAQLTAPKGGAAVISSTVLSGDGGVLPAADVVYRVTRTPANGSLRLNNVPLSVGGTFTQADVNTGKITYLHNGGGALSDSFRYAVAGLTTLSADTGGGAPNAQASFPTVSANGRRTAFYSTATDLVAGDTNTCAAFGYPAAGTCPDIFVRDVISNTTTRVSVSSAGVQGDGPAGLFSSISADGRYVAFESSASNLVTGDTNTCASSAGNCPDIFVRDLQTNTTTRVSVGITGTQAADASGRPAISADGRYVVFDSLANNLVTGDSGFSDIFRKDTQTGAITRVSVDSGGGQANNDSYSPAISADGRYVVFHSTASDLVANDTNTCGGYTTPGTCPDVFLRDMQTNITIRVSVATGGAQGNGFSGNPSVSDDGRYVAFVSSADNLVSSDSNGEGDIFVRDIVSGTTTLVSLDANGNSPTTSLSSDDPAITANGQRVAFVSGASFLVALDNNSAYDVFTRDWFGGQTVRASTSVTGTEANGLSYYSDITDDGRFVVFDSFASTLVTPGNSVGNVFLRFVGHSATAPIAVRYLVSLPIIRR